LLGWMSYSLYPGAFFQLIISLTGAVSLWIFRRPLIVGMDELR